MSPSTRSTGLCRSLSVSSTIEEKKEAQRELWRRNDVSNVIAPVTFIPSTHPIRLSQKMNSRQQYFFALPPTPKLPPFFHLNKSVILKWEVQQLRWMAELREENKKTFSLLLSDLVWSLSLSTENVETFHLFRPGRKKSWLEEQDTQRGIKMAARGWLDSWGMRKWMDDVEPHTTTKWNLLDTRTTWSLDNA